MFSEQLRKYSYNFSQRENTQFKPNKNLWYIMPIWRYFIAFALRLSQGCIVTLTLRKGILGDSFFSMTAQLISVVFISLIMFYLE